MQPGLQCPNPGNAGDPAWSPLAELQCPFSLGAHAAVKRCHAKGPSPLGPYGLKGGAWPRRQRSLLPSSPAFQRRQAWGPLSRDTGSQHSKALGNLSQFISASGSRLQDGAHLCELALEADEVDLGGIGPKVAGNVEIYAVHAAELWNPARTAPHAARYACLPSARAVCQCWQHALQ